MIEGKFHPHEALELKSKDPTEIPDPTVQGPRIMIACVGIGMFTGFIFLMVLLLVAGPIEDVIESAAGPLLHIFFNATNSRSGSIILLLAFNAIISASVVALGVSYAMPIAINCLRGRKMLGPRPFVLPEPFAWFANLLGLAYVIVTTVLFLFPPELPVTGSNMNYCIVAFAIVIIISTFQWFVDGRKNFKGPSIDEGLVHDEVLSPARGEIGDIKQDGDGKAA
ncbi:MAG: hypothetical protein L6R41_008260 [Letrouitia leprolyta]|nr:MAG: hypothetical protein L6R41_008260 [Letrouitia leprolyta]